MFRTGANIKVRLQPEKAWLRASPAPQNAVKPNVNVGKRKTISQNKIKTR